MSTKNNLLLICTVLVSALLIITVSWQWSGYANKDTFQVFQTEIENIIAENYGLHDGVTRINFAQSDAQFIYASVSTSPGGYYVILFRQDTSEKFTPLLRSQEAPPCSFVIEYNIPTTIFGPLIDGCYEADENGNPNYISF